MTAICEHGMPSPASCTSCMFEGVMPDPPPKPEASHWIAAHYAGLCAACDRDIEVGDQIGNLDGVWHCARCVR